jgi:endonuclease YncB( thermonuclease family)
LKKRMDEKILLRCYAVLITIVALSLIGCINHGAQGQVADTLEESAAVIPYNPLPSRSTSPVEAGVWDIVRIVDGDTLIIGDSTDREKQYRVRLVGVDAPELARGSTPAEPYAIEATEFVKQKIEAAGNKVRIAFDGEELDQYRRTRAMVYLAMPDGTEVWLNELLVLEGLAHARLEFRYSHEAKLKLALAEVKARENRKNLWRE